MPPFAGFIGPAYAARAFQADAEDSINWYPEAIESQGGRTKTTYSLLSKPGFQRFAKVAGALAIRAEAALNNRAFFIAQTGAANFFYELHQDGSYTNLGTLAGDRRPQIVPGLTQILILAGGLGYIFDLKANSLARIVDPDFPIGAVKGGFLDAFFIVLEPNSQTFAISALNDGFSWDALDFSDVEGEPGNITTFVVDHRQIWFLGNNHSEIYVNSGNANFPFVRLDGAYMEQGAGTAIDGAFRCDNTIFWLGGNADGQGVCWRANGYTPQRISTHAIEKLIASYGDLSRVSSYPYQEEGHTFARWDFPDAYDGRGASLLYDCAGGFWHRRAFWNAKLGQYMGDLARTHMFVWGKHLVGDWRSGSIYEQSMDFFSDAGAAIRRLRAAPDLANGGKWTYYPEFRLLMDVGVGLDGGPEILADYLFDSGGSWSGNTFALNTQVLGPPAPSGTPPSTASITFTVNSAFVAGITDPAFGPCARFNFTEINPTAGRRLETNIPGHDFIDVYPPDRPDLGPSTLTADILFGTALYQFHVDLGEGNGAGSLGPLLAGGNSLDATVTINDGFGHVTTYPIVLSGGALDTFLSQTQTPNVATFTPDPGAFFRGWDTPSAFGPPWYLTSFDIDYSAGGDTSGTVTVHGIAGDTAFDVTLDADGLAHVVCDPPIACNVASSFVTTGPGGEGEFDLTAHFSSLAESGDIPEGGAPAGDGTDPQIILQWSNNGGKTWAAERPKSCGKLGDYSRLVRWRQTPRSNNRCFRAIYSEPTDASLVAADLDIEPGN